jgi:hypothetical protein
MSTQINQSTSEEFLKLISSRSSENVYFGVYIVSSIDQSTLLNFVTQPTKISLKILGPVT